MPTQSDIGAQLSAFGQAPIPYVTEAILVAMLVWLLSRSINKGVVDTLRERLNLAIDRFRAANDEAENVRQKLEDLRRLMPSLSSDTEAAAATVAAQSGVRELVHSNNRAIAYLSGETQVSPHSIQGPASKPQAKR